jgi:hypothetical protein
MYNVWGHKKADMFEWRRGAATTAGADYLAPFCVKFLCMRDIYVYVHAILTYLSYSSYL